MERPHDGKVRSLVALIATEPDPVAVTVFTLGELHAGVQASPDAATAALRQRTLDLCEDMAIALPTEATTAAFGRMVGFSRKVGQTDRWIVATASVTGATLVTFDAHIADAVKGTPFESTVMVL